MQISILHPFLFSFSRLFLWQYSIRHYSCHLSANYSIIRLSLCADMYLCQDSQGLSETIVCECAGWGSEVWFIEGRPGGGNASDAAVGSSGQH